MMEEIDINTDWFVFGGDGSVDLASIPDAPPWRNFENENRKTGKEFNIDIEAKALVNTAIYLRRPLLVTGPPGTGKSSLAHAIAKELDLDDVISWPINSRSTVKDALYQYDPIGRLQSSQDNPDGAKVDQSKEIGRYLRLGPLGTAFALSKNAKKEAGNKPTVLLIDEIDKSDIDLANDLLHIFEDGQFAIPEISRLKLKESVEIRTHNDQIDFTVNPNGQIVCEEFPIVIITSNGERELPSPFMRRCLSLDIDPPNMNRLVEIAGSHLQSLDEDQIEEIRKLAHSLVNRREKNEYVATDQLLNAAYLIMSGIEADKRINLSNTVGKQKLLDFILKTISYIDVKK